MSEDAYELVDLLEHLQQLEEERERASAVLKEESARLARLRTSQAVNALRGRFELLDRQHRNEQERRRLVKEAQEQARLVEAAAAIAVKEERERRAQLRAQWEAAVADEGHLCRERKDLLVERTRARESLAAAEGHPVHWRRITVVGPSGCGKSSLVREALETFGEHGLAGSVTVSSCGIGTKRSQAYIAREIELVITDTQGGTQVECCSFDEVLAADILVVFLSSDCQAEEIYGDLLVLAWRLRDCMQIHFVIPKADLLIPAQWKQTSLGARIGTIEECVRRAKEAALEEIPSKLPSVRRRAIEKLEGLELAPDVDEFLEAVTPNLLEHWVGLTLFHCSKDYAKPNAPRFETSIDPEAAVYLCEEKNAFIMSLPKSSAALPTQKAISQRRDVAMLQLEARIAYVKVKLGLNDFQGSAEASKLAAAAKEALERWEAVQALMVIPYEELKAKAEMLGVAVSPDMDAYDVAVKIQHQGTQLSAGSDKSQEAHRLETVQNLLAGSHEELMVQAEAFDVAVTPAVDAQDINIADVHLGKQPLPAETPHEGPGFSQEATMMDISKEREVYQQLATDSLEDVARALDIDVALGTGREELTLMLIECAPTAAETHPTAAADEAAATNAPPVPATPPQVLKQIPLPPTPSARQPRATPTPTHVSKEVAKWDEDWIASLVDDGIVTENLIKEAKAKMAVYKRKFAEIFSAHYNWDDPDDKAPPEGPYELSNGGCRLLKLLYRILALKLHPDMRGSSSHEAFQALHEVNQQRDLVAMLTIARELGRPVPLGKAGLTQADLKAECMSVVSQKKERLKDMQDKLEWQWATAEEAERPRLKKDFINCLGSKYEGELNEEKKAHGKGITTYPDGAFYLGGYKKGRRDGFGIRKEADGAIYVGEFKDGYEHGQGQYTWECPQGSGEHHYYEGDYAEGTFHGQGRTLFHTGEMYEGAYRKGQKHGLGTLVSHEGDIWEGTWVDGEMEGNFYKMQADGILYEGDYSKGKKHGFGVITYPDGVYSHWDVEYHEGELKGLITKYTRDGEIETEFRD